MLVAVVPPLSLNAATSDQSGHLRWDVISAMTPACREAVRAGDLSCVHLSFLLLIHCHIVCDPVGESCVVLIGILDLCVQSEQQPKWLH